MMINIFWFWLGMLVFFAVLLTILFRLEKRMVNPYGELAPAPFPGDSSGYPIRWLNDAMQTGFTFLGWADDARSSTYSLHYAFLVSAEHDTFAVIGAGMMLNIPFQATWLYTPVADGRTFSSTDKQSGVQIDHSGNWANQLAFALHFGKLLQKHREWVQSFGVLPRGFTPGREFAEYRALREAHFRSMERAGLLRFTDASATHFHFTLTGAARTATWSYRVGLARRLSHGSFPRSA